ncbi:MAG: hypothetical protein JXL80_11345, partial [Planctomycetes bacterium]|nr:hypothetical protein [Planctomycetota bacterium]
MKRRHVLAACLTIAAAVCSTVQAGFERLEPVPPAEPVPERVRREFDRRYGEAVKAALATETIEDDNALVHRIYTEAAKLRRDPPLLAHTLDEAIRLASICPDRQKLVYDTLKLQAAESLRPAL